MKQAVGKILFILGLLVVASKIVPGKSDLPAEQVPAGVVTAVFDDRLPALSEQEKATRYARGVPGPRVP